MLAFAGVGQDLATEIGCHRANDGGGEIDVGTAADQLHSLRQIVPGFGRIPTDRVHQDGLANRDGVPAA